MDVVAEPLHIPEFMMRATIILLALGLPATLALAWLLDFAGEDSPSTPDSTTTDAAVSPRRNLVETSLLALLAVGMVWLIAKDITSGEDPFLSAPELPVVILMDTYAPRGVYDEEAVLRSNTNADVLSNKLADLPAILQKEAIGAIWNRESQIVKQNPAVVVIHRSAFFHSMNQEFGFGYPDEPDTWDREKRDRLYEIADNKLVAFLGYIATRIPHTRFVVYSRGTGGEWADPEYRANWIQAAENRFESLSGRLAVMQVPGGVERGSFRNPEAVDAVRDLIVSALEARVD